MSTLTSARVEEIFTACKSIGGEPTEDVVWVIGGFASTEFNAHRLNDHRQEIHAMIGELPEVFHTDIMGSLHRGCTDQNGQEWTNDHFVVDKLFMLGFAIDAGMYVPLPSICHFTTVINGVSAFRPQS